MSDHFVTDGSFINSIVGEGTEFRGDLKLNGLLRIDGDFSGSITTDGKILVGKNGRAECTIKAGTVVVGGVVRGNISSDEKVIILSTGMVIGNISTPRLIVEEGVVLNGNCLISRSAIIGRTDSTEPQSESRAEGREDRSAAENASGRDAGAVVTHEDQAGLTSWSR
jgi:cytoskeletal protein CcmA (bactofilin family)